MSIEVTHAWLTNFRYLTVNIFPPTGAIQDVQAGLVATDIFPKSWTQHDPSAEYIMSQSAPLMVPGRPNATLKATVL